MLPCLLCVSSSGTCHLMSFHDPVPISIGKVPFPKQGQMQVAKDISLGDADIQPTTLCASIFTYVLLCKGGCCENTGGVQSVMWLQFYVPSSRSVPPGETAPSHKPGPSAGSLFDQLLCVKCRRHLLWSAFSSLGDTSGRAQL